MEQQTKAIGLILGNKTFKNRPPFNSTDVFIPRFRRWFFQFYDEKSETFEEAIINESKLIDFLLDW